MPARLDTLMARVLRRHERLVLLKLVSSGDAAQTVDFAVRGAYLELLAYVDALEHELPGLRWETLSLGARGADTELQARVALPGSVR